MMIYFYYYFIGWHYTAMGWREYGEQIKVIKICTKNTKPQVKKNQEIKNILLNGINFLKLNISHLTDCEYKKVYFLFSIV
jgi:hypothetical protein